MIVQTSTTNMKGWMSSGWTITSEHIPEALVPPLWPMIDGELRLDAEDEMDLATARKRLLEIENDPSRLVKGEELRARLDFLET